MFNQTNCNFCNRAEKITPFGLSDLEPIIINSEKFSYKPKLDVGLYNDIASNQRLTTFIRWERQSFDSISNVSFNANYAISF